MATRPTGARRTGSAARACGIRYRVNRRPNHGQPLTAMTSATQSLRSATRARGEHAFHVVKTPVGLYQGALPRAGEEHRAAVHGVRAGEPVHGQATADHATGDVCLVNVKAQKERDIRP